MSGNAPLLSRKGRFLLSGVPEGYDAVVLAGEFAKVRAAHLHVARDAARMDAMAATLGFFAPEIRVLRFPAWDCLPYDRVSPNREVAAERIATLAALAAPPAGAAPLVLTTVNAILQRTPPRSSLRRSFLRLETGRPVAPDDLHAFFARNGFERVGNVREPGEFAVRGGIVDLFPPGEERPLRLDFFGNDIEAIRVFDAGSQRATGERRDAVALLPAGEVPLDAESIARFREGYRGRFGAVADDPFYVAISEGRRQIGMEHWLPLFEERLETLFDYVPDAALTLDYGVDDARDARLATIADYYDARTTWLESHGPAADAYRPLPPETLYLDVAELERATAGRTVGQFTPFAAPEGATASPHSETVAFGGTRAPDFSAPAAAPEDGPAAWAARELRAGRKLVVTGLSAGSRARLGEILEGHGLRGLVAVDSWSAAAALPAGAGALAVLPVEHGFRGGGISLLTEQDALGERIVRPRGRRRAEDFIADVSEVSEGDLVVHLEHGIGRYEKLETLDVAGAPHDCLCILYANDARLYVPVENLETLSRYGTALAPLDRLGSGAWQARRARMANRLRDMADQLIGLAARRSLKSGPAIAPVDELYRQFAARFAYEETDDQIAAIDDTLGDLQSGRPMDRLVCGDVGFGKTEVALRAAFATAASGAQVAVVVPTTLLCRQHFATFGERFAGTALRVAQLSRFVPERTAREIRAGLADGSVDIVVGTHALLGKSVRFRNLGLLVVDEEQRFGVRQKEALKKLRADVHVLTLTATPIPRTLQMALTGVRDMSVIGTPPVDRIAVRTYVAPYDPVMIREAIMRERFRGGQTFYVCPRIADLDEVEEELRGLVPEVGIEVAHGRLGAARLEEAMSSFYERKTDLLLSTQIVESGLDIPTANTMIVHRADMYGLADLYQLRGRIGRSRLRAYCYLLLPSRGTPTGPAGKRLEAMQALDTLGAGFRLANHDLDIRGAGNLLGEEQSGHIREVGVELYQNMLEEAVAAARGSDPEDEDWIPAISLGIPVLIPEGYVSDLGIRLGLYRRIARLADGTDSEAFAAELIDRFGSLPDEVENLLGIVAIKRDCRRAGIERLDAGPKGATVAFRKDSFADPDALVRFVMEESARCRMRPDNRLVWRGAWSGTAERMQGARRLAGALAEIAGREAAPGAAERAPAVAETDPA